MLFAPVQLHIPDGFLTIPIAILGWAIALVMIGFALRQTSRQLGERQIPMMGVLAAFIFAAQAINFPVAAGTSGHLLGGALAAIVMGPWAATLIMTAVIAIQGLLFQDGGLVVMGWNILNMGVFTAFTGYAVYSFATRMLGQKRGVRLGGAFVGAWVSVVVGAIATAFELSASGTSPLNLAFPAMAGVHALIGIGEGMITVGSVSFLLMSRPEILQQAEIAPGRRGANLVVVGLVVAVLVAAFSPLASPNPDGLEKVAEELGFLALGESPVYEILPDYTIPFINHDILTTIFAVIVGSLLVFGVFVILGRSRARSQGAGD